MFDIFNESFCFMITPTLTGRGLDNDDDYSILAQNGVSIFINFIYVIYLTLIIHHQHSKLRYFCSIPFLSNLNFVFESVSVLVLIDDSGTQINNINCLSAISTRCIGDVVYHFSILNNIAVSYIGHFKPWPWSEYSWIGTIFCIYWFYFGLCWFRSNF